MPPPARESPLLLPAAGQGRSRQSWGSGKDVPRTSWTLSALPDVCVCCRGVFSPSCIHMRLLKRGCPSRNHRPLTTTGLACSPHPTGPGCPRSPRCPSRPEPQLVSLHLDAPCPFPSPGSLGLRVLGLVAHPWRGAGQGGVGAGPPRGAASSWRPPRDAALEHGVRVPRAPSLCWRSYCFAFAVRTSFVGRHVGTRYISRP